MEQLRYKSHEAGGGHYLLKENGYTPVFINDLIRYVNFGYELPEKPCVLTFDDGNYNNLTYVLPLMEKYDFKCTISVVGSYSEIAKKRSRAVALIFIS